MRVPAQPGTAGAFDWKAAPKKLERQFPGSLKWEPCTIRDLAMSCGWGARPAVMQGGMAVSRNGVAYRRRTVP